MTHFSKVMPMLMNRARGTLTPEDRAEIQAAGNYAVETLERLGRTLEGIGCMVANDQRDPLHKDGLAETGVFQEAHNLSPLLWSVAACIDAMAGFAGAAIDAGDQLTEPPTTLA